MNRVLQLVIAVTVVSVACVATVAAQSARVGLGGGLIAPLSDYKNGDKAGWQATANVEFGIPLSPVGVRVDGLYGQTKHKDFGGSPVDGKTRLIGGLASVVWSVPIPAPMVKPYVLVGGGFYNVKITVPSAVPPVDTSESKFAYSFGGGLKVGVGPARFFVEGRYVSIQTSGASTKFIPVTVGVTFGAK
jgi:Outer membrane protein beta-barrel domain